MERMLWASVDSCLSNCGFVEEISSSWFLCCISSGMTSLEMDKRCRCCVIGAVMDRPPWNIFARSDTDSRGAGAGEDFKTGRGGVASICVPGVSGAAGSLLSVQILEASSSS